MIHIYNTELSTRIEYILNFVFIEVLGESYQLYTDENQYLNSSGPKINYSSRNIDPKEIRIYNEGFLTEKGIRNFSPTISKNNELIKVFLDPNTQAQADDKYIDFDIFSAIFYFISRYEEYLSFKKDVHGRFEADQSFAFKNDFLHKPLVDIYIQYLREKLVENFSDTTFNNRKFEVIPTIDIDQVFAIKEKNIFRWMFALFKAIITLNFKQAGKLFIVRLSSKKDPFDVYDEFDRLHALYNLKAIYFFLYSKKRTKYDINLSRYNKAFRKTIQKISKNSTIGIHPSYYSRSNTRIVEEELSSLSQLTAQLIDSSRQHFLKMRLPNTYKSLLAIGIQNEYTMGYASTPGFRASTSLSFKYYDIKHEQISFLTVHPFSVMDATFKHYLKYSPDQALESICEIIEEIKKVNGQFIPLWHNESMSNYAEWEGWQGVYAEILGYCFRESIVASS